MIVRRPSRVLASGLLTLTLLASAGRPCAADEPAAAPRPTLSESLTGDAKTDYEAAKVLFENGDFAGAATKFGQAHERTKDPRLLWNIAVCEKGLRHYVRVQKLVARYLEEGRDLASPEQARAARALVEAVKPFVGTLKISAEPGAEIAIDGEPVGVTPLPARVPVDLGSHKLTAEKQGFRSFAAAFTIAGGDETSLDVVMKAQSTKARLSVLTGEGDSIAFDGTVVAVTRWQAEVEAGTHALRVTAPRRKPYEIRLDLEGGANRTVEVTLESESRPLWPWIAGGIALSGLAVVGGYFLFKGDERPAEQPQGSLPPGAVQLSRWAR